MTDATRETTIHVSVDSGGRRLIIDGPLALLEELLAVLRVQLAPDTDRVDKNTNSPYSRNQT